MFDPLTLSIIALTFLLAGLVKGVIGLGLPTVSLGLLVATFDLTTAMALMIVPSLITNIWQAMVGGFLRFLLVRLWPFLLAATLTVWLGAAVLTRVELWLLSMLLGGLLVVYALFSLSGFRLTVQNRFEPWAGTGLGMINGILTGMTGSFAVPGILYLQAIGLNRDQLVQAMGLLFSVSTLALALALQRHQLLNLQLGQLSLLAVVPATLGMYVGQRIRDRLSERRFRLIFFISLLILGLYIMVKALP